MKNEDFYSEPYKTKESWTVDMEFKPSYDMVGVQGFEPWTPWSQTRCANQAALHSEKLVPHERIELPSTDYKTVVLPLY